MARKGKAADDEEASLLLLVLQTLEYDDAESVAIVAQYMAEQALARRVSAPPVQFSLDDYDDVTSYRRFRFTREQIRLIGPHLDLPHVIYTSLGCQVPREEAFCMLLRRLTYPARLDDLRTEFGRTGPVLSSAINETAELVYPRVKEKLKFDHRMVDRYKDRSADAIYAKVGRLTKCLGFIDGTIRETCRPVRYQDQVYSGHKRKHGIKFQNVTMANGMIVAMYGRVEGRRHDGFMLQESEIVDDMERYEGFHLCGDQGYPLRSWLVTPFTQAKRTREQRGFNRDLSRARIAVEWSFGWIVRYWKFFALKSNMKMFKSRIAKLFLLATFFTNCLSCVRRKNQASEYFRCRPPTLEIYLADLSGAAVNEEDYVQTTKSSNYSRTSRI